MREIKFRAWDLLPQKWESDECEDLRFFFIMFEENGLCDLEQYTGLKDKNGKEIYEGDLLDVEDASGEVVFHKEYLGFFVKVSEYEQTWKPLYDVPVPEIIGNIHENTDLLEGKN